MRCIAFLFLLFPFAVSAQEDCQLFNLQDLAAENLALHDSIAQFSVDTVILLPEGNLEVLLSNGAAYSIILGCTDPAFTEYNASANTDDGSCATLPCLDDVEMDGYSYSVVEIGDQCWFAENLRTTTYADGTAIPEVTDWGTWGGLSSGARSDYGNDAGNVETYGRLYNWYAVDDARGLCPNGWHVPTDDEWTELETHVGANGHSGTEGTALKSTSGWYIGNGTDDFGFSGLPGGYRHSEVGDFFPSGNIGYWWSSSSNGGDAWCLELNGSRTEIPRYIVSLRYGFSVRCLRD